MQQWGSWPVMPWPRSDGGASVSESELSVAERAVYALEPYSWVESDSVALDSLERIEAMLDKARPDTGIRRIDASHSFLQPNAGKRPLSPVVIPGLFGDRPVVSTTGMSLQILRSSAPPSAWSLMTDGSGVTMTKFFRRTHSPWINTVWFGTQAANARTNGYDNNLVFTPEPESAFASYYSVGQAATTVYGHQPGGFATSETVTFQGTVARMYSRNTLRSSNLQSVPVAGPPPYSMVLGADGLEQNNGSLDFVGALWFARELAEEERFVVLRYGFLKWGIEL